MANKTDPTISKVMKQVRAQRKDYSTSGFKNPEVQARIKKIKADKNVQSDLAK